MLKNVGSVVIPRQHVLKIQLDKKFQRLYDEETKPRLVKSEDEADNEPANSEEPADK